MTAPDWDYAAHIVALGFLHQRLAGALRSKDYAFAATCVHNMRQHLDGIDKWLKEQAQEPA